MKTSNTRRCALCVCVLVILAGCSDGASQLARAPSNVTRLSTLATGSGVAISVHPDRRRSWMASDAKTTDLLYSSDVGNNDVYVYSYPQRKLKGVLTGFNEPQGECVDSAGDIWIANTDDSDILEYAHGGKSPIATLADPGQYPVGCSIDPTTGNLAVTNFLSYGSGQGGISIYQDAQGTPTTYTDPDIYSGFFPSYDNAGNLFFDGRNDLGEFQFAELPKGAGTITNVALNQSIGWPGGVQWDGKYLAVANQSTDYEPANVIYQFAISGSAGTEVGSTPLRGSCDVVQFWIQAQKVIGPDYCNNDIGFWKYPAGGRARETIIGNFGPIGSAISRRQ